MAPKTVPQKLSSSCFQVNDGKHGVFNAVESWFTVTGKSYKVQNLSPKSLPQRPSGSFHAGTLLLSFAKVVSWLAVLPVTLFVFGVHRSTRKGYIKQISKSVNAEVTATHDAAQEVLPRGKPRSGSFSSSLGSLSDPGYAPSGSEGPSREVTPKPRADVPIAEDSGAEDLQDDSEVSPVSAQIARILSGESREVGDDWQALGGLTSEEEEVDASRSRTQDRNLKLKKELRSRVASDKVALADIRKLETETKDFLEGLAGIFPEIGTGEVFEDLFDRFNDTFQDVIMGLAYKVSDLSRKLQKSDLNPYQYQIIHGQLNEAREKLTQAKLSFHKLKPFRYIDVASKAASIMKRYVELLFSKATYDRKIISRYISKYSPKLKEVLLKAEGRESVDVKQLIQRAENVIISAQGIEGAFLELDEHLDRLDGNAKALKLVYENKQTALQLKDQRSKTALQKKREATSKRLQAQPVF